MDATQTGLIVPVPAAEHAVGPHRASLDRAASWGVPAHVTVLYPFLPPARLDAAVLDALRAVVATRPAFTTALTRVGWFGDDVAWLAPDPDQPFRDLTTAIWARFPEVPPYSGAFDDVVPHLTIGHDAPRPALEAAATAAAAHLPIAVEVEVVHLITGTPDRAPWRTLVELPLGPRVPTTP